MPELPDLRLALDVAAADLRPLVVLYSKDEKKRKQLRERVGSLAWSEDFVGRLREMGASTVQEVDGVNEAVEFQLPRAVL